MFDTDENPFQVRNTDVDLYDLFLWNILLAR